MSEPKRRWQLVTDNEHEIVLHTFTARGRMKAELKACRRLNKRYGALVAHGLVPVRLEIEP